LVGGGTALPNGEKKSGLGNKKITCTSLPTEKEQPIHKKKEKKLEKTSSGIRSPEVGGFKRCPSPTMLEQCPTERVSALPEYGTLVKPKA